MVAMKELQKDDSHTEAELTAASNVVKVVIFQLMALSYHRMCGHPEFFDLCSSAGVWVLSLIYPGVLPFQATLLRKFPHRHVIKTFQPLEDAFGAFLPMELCDGGDLFSLAESQPGGAVPECIAKRIFREVISGLQHCHGLGIYHGDVKPENILLCGGEAKLTDFGAASFSRGLAHRPCSTALYGSPEATAAFKLLSGDGIVACHVLDSKPDPAASDVWSLGVSIVSVTSGYLPWETAHHSDHNYRKWSEAVAECESEGCVPLTTCGVMMFGGEWYKSFSLDLVDLVCRMLHPTAEKRPTLAEIASHRWFSALNAAKRVKKLKQLRIAVLRHY
jgi:serine/threonine protein kinase